MGLGPDGQGYSHHSDAASMHPRPGSIPNTIACPRISVPSRFNVDLAHRYDNLFFTVFLGDPGTVCEIHKRWLSPSRKQMSTTPLVLVEGGMVIETV